MSDRRVVVLVIASLLGVLGAVVAVTSTLASRNPVWRDAETYQPVDHSGELLGTLTFGVLLLVAGVVTATGLIRAQRRTGSR